MPFRMKILASRIINMRFCMMWYYFAHHSAPLRTKAKYLPAFVHKGVSARLREWHGTKLRFMI